MERPPISSFFQIRLLPSPPLGFQESIKPLSVETLFCCGPRQCVHCMAPSSARAENLQLASRMNRKGREALLRIRIESISFYFLPLTQLAEQWSEDTSGGCFGELNGRVLRLREGMCVLSFAGKPGRVCRAGSLFGWGELAGKAPHRPTQISLSPRLKAISIAILGQFLHEPPEKIAGTTITSQSLFVAVKAYLTIDLNHLLKITSENSRGVNSITDTN